MSEIEYRDEHAKATVRERPTPRLRLFRRAGANHDVLQQVWSSLIQHDGGRQPTYREDWRDVPRVEEAEESDKS